MTIQQTVSPLGLYPPKHYSKATNTPATAWSPGEQPTSEEFSQIFHKTELKLTKLHPSADTDSGPCSVAQEDWDLRKCWQQAG